ncbi:OPI10 family protein [Aspergillus lucknowensis]|uniref:Hikeshi-like domain-containing protein n=1 Tax=Aspergillus lucknowensis TaxID=176173 RepID=A0ABR4LCS0_9EURO
MFSIILPGRPCLTDIVAIDPQPTGQATKFAFKFPLTPYFSEIVVFFLPGTVLPQDTAAAIYIQYPDAEFQFIGALANETPSAVFKVTPPRRTEAQDEDQMLDDASAAGNAANSSPAVTLGISIEPVQVVAPQVAALEAESGNNKSGGSTELVRQTQQKGISTKVLAQRIIGNAFNFLASFAGSDPSGGGQEVVPLKAFQDWWTKFERRVNVDPTFLEREDPRASG